MLEVSSLPRSAKEALRAESDEEKLFVPPEATRVFLRWKAESGNDIPWSSVVHVFADEDAEDTMLLNADEEERSAGLILSGTATEDSRERPLVPLFRITDGLAEGAGTALDFSSTDSASALAFLMTASSSLLFCCTTSMISCSAADLHCLSFSRPAASR